MNVSNCPEHPNRPAESRDNASSPSARPSVRVRVSLPRDYRERAKQARFLQYRKFSSDQIRAALGPDEDEPDA
jgi:SOS response regulatory protein OraA/RecX